MTDQRKSNEQEACSRKLLMMWCVHAWDLMMSGAALELVRQAALAKLATQAGASDHVRQYSDEMVWMMDHMEIFLFPLVGITLAIMHLDALDKPDERG